MNHNRVPFRRFEMLSPLSIEQARARLAEHVHPGSVFTWERKRPPVPLPFLGRVGARSFRIERQSLIRYDLRPIIHGTLAPHPQGTLVTVYMRMTLLTYVFRAVSLGVAGWVITSMLMAGEAEANLVFGASMLALASWGTWMSFRGFGAAAATDQKGLREIFRTRDVRSAAPMNRSPAP